MAKYIDISKLSLDNLEKNLVLYDGAFFYEDLEKYLRGLPVSSEPIQKAQWKRSEIPGEEYVCSNCGASCWYYALGSDGPHLAKSRYCPTCGSRMDMGVPAETIQEMPPIDRPICLQEENGLSLRELLFSE